MRMLFAKLFGTPLVSVRFGYGRIARILKHDGDGVPYVKLYGAIEYNCPYRNFKPLINCTSKDLTVLPPKITGGE